MAGDPDGKGKLEIGARSSDRFPITSETTLPKLVLAVQRERAIDLVDSTGNPLDARKAREEVERLLGRLSSTQLQRMLDSILSGNDADDKDLEARVCLKLLTRLAGKDPAQALAFLERTALRSGREVPDLFTQAQVAGVNSEGMMNFDANLMMLGLTNSNDLLSILAGAAGTDPRVAVDWLRIHPLAFGCRSGEAVSGVVTEIVNRKGLAIGLEMARELEKHSWNLSAGAMAMTTHSGGERLDLIAALHGSGPRIEDAFAMGVLTGLGRVAVKQDGYAEARTWLDTAPLSNEEKQAVLKGMEGEATVAEGSSLFLPQ